MHDPSQRPSRRSWLVIGLIAGLAQLGLALPAQASEGYFQNGIGARHKALAGAGVADGRDATAAALNPAGLVHAPNEASLALSILSPRREFEGSGGTATTNLTPTGVVESDGEPGGGSRGAEPPEQAIVATARCNRFTRAFGEEPTVA